MHHFKLKMPNSHCPASPQECPTLIPAHEHLRLEHFINIDQRGYNDQHLFAIQQGEVRARGQVRDPGQNGQQSKNHPACKG